MQNKLCKIILEHRAKGEKVSKNFMQALAKKLMKTAQLEFAETFKASNG